MTSTRDLLVHGMTLTQRSPTGQGKSLTFSLPFLRRRGPVQTCGWMPVRFPKPLCLKGTERAARLAGQAGHLVRGPRFTFSAVPWASRMETHKSVSCCPSGHPCCNHQLRSCESGVPPTPPPPSPPMTRLHATQAFQAQAAEGQTGSTRHFPQLPPASPGPVPAPPASPGPDLASSVEAGGGAKLQGRGGWGHLSPRLHPTL